MTFRMLAAAVVVGCGLLLTGCVPPADVIVPVETVDAQPVFASDEEALAAAVEVYEEYLFVSGSVGADGGVDHERIHALVTDDLYASEAASFTALEDRGGYQRGFAQVHAQTLQQTWEDPVGVAHVIAYFCVDLAEVRFFDSSGTDVTSPEREDLGIAEVEFVSSAMESTKLLVSEVRAWPDSGSCSQS